MLFQTLKRISYIVAALVVIACGNSGEDGSGSSSEELGDAVDVLGSITSQTGNQSDMNGWVVVATDKYTNISRVAEVNSAGLFTLKKVYTGAAYTLNLVSPAYIISSVLSMPSKTPGTIKQFFKITSKNLPRLIHKGPIFSFENEVGISMQNDLAADADSDGIPDGIASLSLAGINLGLVDNYRGALLAGSNADLDTDGIKNSEDPDIDGDGLINIFDADDDQDGTYDIFDQDSDGDLVSDVGQTTSDLFFKSGVEWITVKFEMVPVGDGTYKSSLIFYTKLRTGGVTPSVVQIRGAPSLLNGALVETVDEDGRTAKQAWDKRLLDDGKSEDGSAGDLLFGRKINLKTGTVPTYHQTIFFQLGYGTGEKTWFQEFAYTFPPVTPAAITPRYDSVSKSISLVGNPFGSIQEFLWTASIYDTESKLKVYSTAATTGTIRRIKIPSNIFETGKTYQYKVSAQVLDRVPGYASYTIESSLTDLQ